MVLTICCSLSSAASRALSALATALSSTATCTELLEGAQPAHSRVVLMTVSLKGTFLLTPLNRWFLVPQLNENLPKPQICPEVLSRHIFEMLAQNQNICDKFKYVALKFEYIAKI